MTENEVLEMLLEIKEIQVDQFEVQDQHLHIYCSSIFPGLSLGNPYSPAGEDH